MCCSFLSNVSKDQLLSLLIDLLYEKGNAHNEKKG
jgi:hypothetical protein